MRVNLLIDTLYKSSYLRGGLQFALIILFLAMGIIGINAQCSGDIYDSGGNGGDYSNNEDITTVLTANSGEQIQISFNSFDVEDGNDFLYVHDGPTTGDPLLGTYTGTTLPPDIVSSDTTLTLRFTSDNLTSGSGYSITLSCVTPPISECFAIAESTNGGELFSWSASPAENAYIGMLNGASVESMALSYDGQTIYAADAGIFGTVDHQTGAFVAIATIGDADGALGTIAMDDVDGMAINPNNGLIMAIQREFNSHDLFFAIDPATGLVEKNYFGPGVDYRQVVGALQDMDDIAFHPVTNELFGISTVSNSTTYDQIVIIDQYLGTVTPISSLPTCDIEGLSFNDAGVLYGSSGFEECSPYTDNTVYEIDYSDSVGAVTMITTLSGIDIEALVCFVTAVEPCDDVVSGGNIGAYQDICSGDDVAAFTNLANATHSGGGTIEYTWMYSTTACIVPLNNDPDWIEIPGATGLTYDHGVLLEKTCFVRGARTTGCPEQVKFSNVITVDVNSCICPTPTTVMYSITSGNDDVEQQENNNMYFNSSDLEMINDYGFIQTIGLRFNNINISGNATIQSAQLVFEADEDDSDPATLIIHGELIGNSPPFGSADSYLTTINKTASSAIWSDIEPWIENNAYSTVYINDVIQEIIEQNTWSSGNSLSLILTGGGRRVADSFEKSGGTPPQLVIEYCDVEICDNGIDDDKDGYADSFDPDCPDYAPFDCDSTLYQSISTDNGLTYYLYEVNTNPTSFTQVHNLTANGMNASGFNSLAFNPVDRFLYGINPLKTGNYEMYRINDIGAVQYLGNITGLSGTNDAGCMGSYGTYYVYGESGKLFEINTTTLVATEIVDLGFDGGDMAFNRDDNLIYIWNTDANQLNTVNPITGTTSAIGSPNTQYAEFGALYFDDQGDIIAYGDDLNAAGTDQETLVRIDPGTGVVTPIGTGPNTNTDENDGCSCSFGAGLTKSVSASSAVPGDVLSYTFTVYNRTAQVLQDITFEDILPTGLTYSTNPYNIMGLTLGSPSIIGLNAANFVISEVPPGSSNSFMVDVTIPITYCDDISNQASLLNLDPGLGSIVLSDDPSTVEINDATVTIVVANCEEHWLESECEEVGANWNIVTDNTASLNRYTTIAPGNNSPGSAPTGVDDRIRFNVTITAAGNYNVFARVYTPTDNDDSFWVRANGGTWYKWNDLYTFASSGWTWGQVYDSDAGEAVVTFPLVVGDNTIDIAYREDGAQLDKIKVTTSNELPTGEGGLSMNCPEICDNGIDDDGDGLTDCEDPNCFSHTVCSCIVDTAGSSGVKNELFGTSISRITSSYFDNPLPVSDPSNTTGLNTFEVNYTGLHSNGNYVSESHVVIDHFSYWDQTNNINDNALFTWNSTNSRFETTDDNGNGIYMYALSAQLDGNAVPIRGQYLHADDIGPMETIISDDITSSVNYSFTDGGTGIPYTGMMTMPFPDNYLAIDLGSFTPTDSKDMAITFAIEYEDGSDAFQDYLADGGAGDIDWYATIGVWRQASGYDYSDAAGYTSAGHGTDRCGGALYIGDTRADSELGVISGGITADQGDNVADEVDPGFPDIWDTASDYSLDVAYNNNTGNDATLAAWVDFNNDGVFSIMERRSVVVSPGLDTVPLSWSGISLDAAATNYIVRVRIASDGTEVVDADGFATNGEVEDHIISVLRQEICDNGIDDDGDGLTDCEDPNCFSHTVCSCIVDTTGSSGVKNELFGTSISRITSSYFDNPLPVSDPSNTTGLNTFEVNYTGLHSNGNYISESHVAIDYFSYWDQTNNINDNALFTWNSTNSRFETTDDNGNGIYMYALSATLDGNAVPIRGQYLHSDDIGPMETIISDNITSSVNYSFTDGGTGIPYTGMMTMLFPDNYLTIDLGSFIPTDSKDLVMTFAIEYEDGSDAFQDYLADGGAGDIDWHATMGVWRQASGYDYSDAAGYISAGHGTDRCGGALYIGDTRADSELGVISGGITADQGDNVADEVDLGFPAIWDTVSSYSLDIDYNNNTGNDATLAAWVDFDNDGVFGSGERQSLVVSHGEGTATLNWSGIVHDVAATNYIVRVRIASDGTEVVDADGFATNGEVEDHIISVLRPEICDNGIDDDGDGLMDCEDPNCFSHTVCSCIVDTTGSSGVKNELFGTSISRITSSYFDNPLPASDPSNTTGLNTFEVNYTGLHSNGNYVSESHVAIDYFSYWDQTNNINDNALFTWNSMNSRFETTDDNGNGIYMYALSATLDGNAVPIRGQYLHSDDIGPMETIISDNITSSVNYSFTDGGTGIPYTGMMTMLFPDNYLTIDLGSFIPTDSKDLVMTFAIEYEDGSDAFQDYLGDGGAGDIDWHATMGVWRQASGYDYSDAAGYISAGHGTDRCGGALYIGDTRADSELGVISGGVTADQGDNVADEVDLGFPAIWDTVSSYSLDIDYNNNTGNDATLAAWVDFDNDGVFGSGERQSLVVSHGEGTATLNWSGIVHDVAATNYIVRVRIASDGTEVVDADGFATNGEVEDHIISVLRPEICDNGIDDDGDGLMDCEDPNCFSHTVCSCIVDTTGSSGVKNELFGTSISRITSSYFDNPLPASDPSNTTGLNTFEVNYTGLHSNGNYVSESHVAIDYFSYWDQTNNINDNALFTWNSMNSRFETTDDNGNGIYMYALSATLDGNAVPIRGQYLHADDIGPMETIISDNITSSVNYSFTDGGTGIPYTGMMTMLFPDNYLTIDLGSFIPTDSKDLVMTFAIEYEDGSDAFQDYLGDGGAGDIDWHATMGVWRQASGYDYSDAAGYISAGHGTDRCGGALYIGDTRADSELGVISGGVTADQGDNVADEVDLGFPAIWDTVSSYSLDIDYNNNTGNDATLAAWVDFDNDGVFGSGERQSLVVSHGEGTATLNWSGMVLDMVATNYIVRVRIASDGTEVLSPDGYATNGEVEDHIINVLRPEICDNGIDDDGDGLMDCLDPDCENGVNVNITSVDSILCLGETAVLNAESSGSPGILTYAWSGGAGIAQTALVSPSTTTLYTVTVTNTNGCEATDQIEVTVNNLPVASATNDGPIRCALSNVTMTALPAGLSYQWEGGGTGQTKVVSSTGSYSVTVTDANGCTAVTSTTVTDDFTPPMADAGSDDLICEGESKTLTASGGVSYLWSDGVGSTASVSVSPVVTTIYTVTVTAANGCQDTDDVTISVDPKPIVSITGSDTICVQTTTTLSPNTGGTWQSSDNSIAIVSSSGVVFGLNPGTVSFVFTSSVTGCPSDATADISITPDLSVDIGFSGGICLEDDSQLSANVTGGTMNFTYNWTGPNGFTASTQVIDADESGNYYVTVTDVAGCSDNTSAYIYAAYEPFIFTLNTEVCEDESITLSVNSATAVDYLWSANAGNSTSQSVTVTPGLPSEDYFVTVTNDIGCTTEATVHIDVEAKTAVMVSGADELCIGDSTTLSPTSGGFWTSSDNSIAGVTNDGTVVGLSAGTVTFTFLDTVTNCESDPTTLVTVHPMPIVNVIGPDVICEGDTTILSPATGGTWISNNTLLATVTDNGVVTALSAGSVSFVFTDTMTGCVSNSTVDVTINQTYTATFTGPTSVCLGDITYLTPTSGGTWASNDASVAIISDIGVVTTVGPGSTTFTFTSDFSCESAASAPLTVIDNAVITILGDMEVCEDEVITLTASSPGGTWSSSNNSIATINSSGQVTGIAYGSTTITYTHDPSQCELDATFGITVNEKPTVSVNGPVEICAGEITSVLASSSGGIWSSSDESIAIVSVDGTVVGISAGTATFSYTATNACESDASVPITVNPKVDVDINFIGSVCLEANTRLVAEVSGGSPNFTYSWSGPGGFTSTLDTIDISLSGLYNVLVTDGEGCSSNKTAYVYEAYNPFVFTLDTEICEGEDVTLSINGSSGGTYQWSANAGFATSQSVTVVPSVPGDTYYVTITSPQGCTTVANAAITVDSLPITTLTGGDTICVGGITNLTPTTGGLWSSSNYSVASITNSGIASGLAPGVVTFTFRDTSSGCYSAPTTNVTVLANENILVTGDNDVCMGVPETLTASIPGGTWNSSNTSIATINATGEITPISAGSTSMIYTPVANTCYNIVNWPINVNNIPTVGVNGPSTICEGEITYLAPSNGGIWVSDDTLVATVSNIGIVTGISGGSASFTFTSTAGCVQTLSTPITVIANPTVSLTGPSEICIDGTTTLSPTTGGIWLSSNNVVATVSSSGLVLGINPGIAEFTFVEFANGCISSDTIEVTVNPTPTITGLGDNNICIGVTTTISPTTGGTWLSSDATVATITSGGIITGISAGAATFTYVDNITGCVSVSSDALTVDGNPVINITGDTDLCVGDNSSILPNTGGTWSTSDISIATITNDGTITAVSAGDVTFTFTNDNTGCSSIPSDVFTVNNPSNASIIGVANMCIGTIEVLTCSTGGTWESNNTAIATINSGGVVTANAPGIVTITLNTTASCITDPTFDILVEPNPNPIFTGSTSICLGENTTLSPTSGGVWMSSDDAIATIDNSGNVTSIASGIVEFTFTDDLSGCVATTSTSLSIYNKPVVNISGNSSICIGENTSMSPTFGGVWMSSDNNVATIDANGFVTGISEGAVTFTYTESGTSCVSDASEIVTILPKPSVSITGATSLCIGNTSTLAPSVGGSWISSNAMVATVTDQGIVTAVGQGIARFTFVSNEGCSSDETAPIVVFGIPSITINGSSVLCIGDNVPLLPSSGGTWASNDVFIATIANDGLVTAVSPGNVTFTYTDSSTGCVSAASDIITVSPIPTTGINGPTSICVGATTNFTPTAGGVWASVDPTIATIENNGEVTGISSGSARFIFTELSTGCISDTTVVITVTSESTPVFTGPGVICEGDTSYISPSAGGTWESTNTNVATIANDGMIIGVGQGTAKFRFTNGTTGCTSDFSSSLTVNSVGTVFVDGTANICIGTSTTLSPSSGGTWMSLNPGIASVTSTGIVTGISPGSAYFVFTESTTGCSSDGTLEVVVQDETTINIVGISELCIGYTAALSPSTGGFWTSNNEAIATITNTGIVTGNAPGKVTFTFTESSTGCANKSTSDSITVESCKNHDFNVAVINQEIFGNLSTNDNFPTTVSYSTTPQLISKPDASTVVFNINSDGSYSFQGSKPGNYRYNVPVCIDPYYLGCPSAMVEITLVDNQYSTGNPVTNIDIATIFEVETANRSVNSGGPFEINAIQNDICIYTIGCDMDWNSAGIELGASNGLAEIKPNGIIEYTPDVGFIGFDTIYYSMCADGYANCNSTFQVITVNHSSAVNSIVASDDFNFTLRGSSISGNVLANDSDPEGDTISVTPQGTLVSPIVTSAGEYYIDTLGNFNFTPNENFSGHTEIIYEICDNNDDQACMEATLHLLVFDDINVQIRVYLQGALMENEGATSATGLPLMRDDLRVSPFTGMNYIPLLDPYSVSADPFAATHTKFNKIGPGLMQENREVIDSLGIFGVSGDNAIVDWVHVELRSKTDMTLPIATRSGLLQRDGDIVDLDGVSSLRFNAVNVDSFYVVVKHRSHLGVMSQKVSYSEVVDFTSPAYPVHNFGVQGLNDYSGLSQNNNVISGYSALWAGDFDSNGKVKFTNPDDDQNVLFINVLFTSPDFLVNYDQAYGYLTGDFNMNSKTKYTNPSDDINYLFSQVLLYSLNSSFLSNYNSLIEQVPKDE